jgi:hypothetical protein
MIPEPERAHDQTIQHGVRNAATQALNAIVPAEDLDE